MNPPYSEKEDDRLKVLYRQGLTQKVIADALWREFGIKRSNCSIGGRIARFGIARKPTHIFFKNKDAVKPVLHEPVQIGFGEYKLIDLNHDQCRFPYGTKGNYTFCGKKCDKVYCVEHTALCVSPPTKK